ncbi:MAG: type II secretion system protein GspC [Rhodanobacteraceae bacterium]
MQWRVPEVDRDRATGRAALVACGVLGALAVWLFARLVWLLVPRGDSALDASAARVAATAGSAPAQSIAKWHLFGNTPGATSGANATVSTTGMVLRGTLADRDPAAGIAVISGGGGDGSERAFRAGETVAGGIRLARVYADRVILLREGIEETLALTRDRNLEPGNVVRQRTPGDARTSSSSASAPQSNAVAANPANVRATQAPADWQQTIDRLRQNPDELARRVQIVPVLDGGKLTGVRVAPGSDAALIGQIGLKSGDVVTAINGAPVDSLARGQQILESLRSASNARVTVLRDGKPTDVVISLK